MSITVSDLTNRIRRNTTTYNNIPNPEQIVEFINRSLSDLADKSPHVLTTTISIVAGTATYSLPNDFHSVKSFDMGSGGGYMIGDTMYGSKETYSERITITGGTLVISPTPTTNQDRTLEYYARHISVNGEYPYLEERYINAVIWRAITYICSAKMAEAERVAWVETEGESRIDKTGIFKSIAAEKSLAEQEWSRALASISDPSSGVASGYGRRSSYDTNPYDMWNNIDFLSGGY